MRPHPRSEPMQTPLIMPRAVLFATLLGACKAGPQHALPGDTISVNPTSYEYLVDADADEEDPLWEIDGSGYLAIADFVVLGADGPRASVEIEVTTGDGIALVPSAAVRTVDEP